MEYRSRIHFKSGYVSENHGSVDSKNLLPTAFSEDILEGFYPRDNGQVEFGKSFHEQIARVEFFVNGKRKRESPPLLENGMGYIFSEHGLERMVLPDKDEKLPDVHMDENTQKLDSFISKIDMQKIFEEARRRGISEFTINTDGNIVPSSRCNPPPAPIDYVKDRCLLYKFFDWIFYGISPGKTRSVETDY